MQGVLESESAVAPRPLKRKPFLLPFAGQYPRSPSVDQIVQQRPCFSEIPALIVSVQES